jgi:hypothetical protein
MTSKANEQLAASIARTEQRIIDIQDRLFNGNGAIPTLFQLHKELDAKVDKLSSDLSNNKASLDMEIEKVGSRFREKLAWAAGAGTAIGAVVTFIGKWLLTKVPFIKYP